MEADQVHLLIDEEVEGEIEVPKSSVNNNTTTSTNENNTFNFNTLDEPIRKTISRDLKAVGKKFGHVLYPKQSKTLLKEWDLWGPLMLCIAFAIMLKGSSSEDEEEEPQFAEVFVVYWLGAAVVTLNIKLLGGFISFFQGVCVLGYCVLPLIIALLVSKISLLFGSFSLIYLFKCIFVLFSIGWSVFASTAFLVDSQPPRRKPLALYPIFLFYFFIGWIVFTNN